MRPYLDLLRHVRENGIRKADRTGTGTLSVFGHQMRFDLQVGFPLVTTKRVFFKGLAYEMLWFLRGGTNIDYLNEHGVRIWDAWADEDGSLGPVYGKQWVAWEAPGGRLINQIAAVVEAIRENPDSRRHVVSAWNVADLPDEKLPPDENARRGKMALAPCHMFFQFYVAEGRLSCQLYVRSNDLFLGAPFNIAEYALLTHMIAQQCDLDVGDFIYTIGDAHIYLNHLDQVDEQLARMPYPLPTLRLRRRPPSIFDYTYEDFEVLSYHYHPSIKAPVAV